MEFEYSLTPKLLGNQHLGKPLQKLGIEYIRKVGPKSFLTEIINQ